jgi:UDP-2-acetamido-2-deoxy-ribo-hexuluronate aminotransferase
MAVPFINLRSQYELLQKDIKSRIDKVLEHGMYIMGPEVEECEQILAEFAGVKHAIVVASGTDALIMALLAYEIGVGDEVIMPAFSFIATAEAVALLGATPVFVDIQESTLNLDPFEIEAAITERTKAIMPVSLFGQPADMDEINSIAQRHGLKVIEDGAQSFGASYRGLKSGALSDIGCTSFFPAKPLGCYGDGGAVFTNDTELAQALREIRVHGSSQRYYHTRLGINGRLDSIQCAVLISKMSIFAEEISIRQKWAAAYSEAFADLPHLQLVTQSPERTSAWAQYTLRVKNRAAFQKILTDHGVPSAIHYPLAMHQQSYYKKWAPNLPLSISEKASEEVVSLPICAYLSHENFDKVVEAVRATRHL